MKRRFFALLAGPALRKLSERIHSEEKGFTLIELLVVIAALGVAVSALGFAASALDFAISWVVQILPFIEEAVYRIPS
jgi:prepilin-type N-terminal cleavage/methylation domain-containing protein